MAINGLGICSGAQQHLCALQMVHAASNCNGTAGRGTWPLILPSVALGSTVQGRPAQQGPHKSDLKTQGSRQTGVTTSCTPKQHTQGKEQQI